MEKTSLCKNKPAMIPYHIESIRLNLYTIEELCYFLSENLPFFEKCVMDPFLPDWLENEGGSKEAAQMMRQAAKTETDPAAMGMLLFRVSYYFGPKELEIIRKRVNRFVKLHATEKRKMYADVLMQYDRYMKALREYDEILKMPEMDGRPVGFTATVLHNMGCAYARMMRMDKAEEYFYRAYDKCGTALFRDDYLRAVYMGKKRNALEIEAKKLGADKFTIEDIVTQAESLPVPELPDDPKEAVRQWMKEYHYSMDE